MKMNFKFFCILIIINLLNLYYSKDIFEVYFQKADKILSSMSKNEKIGQLFLARYSLDTVDYQIRKYFPAGFVLFAQNLVNHTEAELIKELNQRQNISKIPLAFGVDEEGGTVCRVSLYFRNESFPSPRDSYLKGGIEEILSIEQEKRNLLKKLKLHYNFAPVADISTNSSDYIYKRTLGENATLTSEYINSVVDSYNNDNFTCCLKHFPGYGNNRNTHDDISHDYRPIDYLKENDLVPFVNAIKHNVPMIKVSHNIVVNIDDEYPASISKKVHDLLRNDYGYTGLIVTDSLSMGAITKYTKDISPAVLAILAGNDIIVTSTFEKHIEELINAVNNNEVDMKLIEKAAKRVIAWKLKYIYEQEKNEDIETNPNSNPNANPNSNPNSSSNSNNSNVILFIIIGFAIIAVIVIFVVFWKYKCNNNDPTKDISKNIRDDFNPLTADSKTD